MQIDEGLYNHYSILIIIVSIFCFRVIGAAHVEDLFSVPEGELLALVLGRAFLLSSSRKGYGDLMSVVKKTLTDYGL